MNWRTLGTVMVVIGLILVVHPLYAWPHHGETQYGVALESVPQDQVPEDATVVRIDDLSPSARNAVLDPSVDLWSEADSGAIEELREADYVKRDESYYSVEVVGLDRLGWPFRPATTLLAGLLMGLGGLFAWARQPRPRSPFPAAWVPLAVLLAFQVVGTLDGRELRHVNVGGVLTGLAFFVTPLGFGVALARRTRLLVALFGISTFGIGVAAAFLAWRLPEALLGWAMVSVPVGTVGYLVAEPVDDRRSLREWVRSSITP